MHLGDPHLSLVRWLRRRIHETGTPPELAHAMHHVTRCTSCSIIRGPSQCSWVLRDAPVFCLNGIRQCALYFPEAKVYKGAAACGPSLAGSECFVPEMACEWCGAMPWRIVASDRKDKSCSLESSFVLDTGGWEWIATQHVAGDLCRGSKLRS